MPQTVERFLADHQDRRGVSARTLVNYRERLGMMRDELGDELTPAAFRRLADERHWSQATRATYYATLATYTAWRRDVGLDELDAFAGMKAPAQPQGNPKPIGDLARVLELARERPRKASPPVDEWAILAAYAGLRTFEIAAVEGRDLRQGPNGYELEVPQGKGGTRASVPASPEVVKLFEGRGAGPLYPGVTAEIVQEAGRRLMRKAGLEGGLHRLRHTFATAIYQATGDPFLTQRLCRHKSLQSTLTYAKLADSRLHDAVAGLHA